MAGARNSGRHALEVMVRWVINKYTHLQTRQGWGVACHREVVCVSQRLWPEGALW